ncbi:MULTISPECIES: Sbal_3080 family lipoprotein [Pseudomonas]|uniref:Sbal_3080 family lipoprotein n=1 Tax=Pseudomonas nitroreducens TaxID=46680 RepID=UPI001E644301|nr:MULTISPECIES: Sbal_3080 family lipoprotein [Pseudomonas]MCE4068864.1 Sbal_3080 family lipoprotein [Pseudomonas nitritireducens]MCE4078053.1 Sbal_3080 family lipoprotein [Pseudomonas nitroreducens]
MRYPILLLPIGAALLSLGCTSVQVEPLAQADAVVCIEKNPKVMVSDFVPVLQDGFARHGITAQVYDGQPPTDCRYQVTYDARRSWDMAPYLSTAEITVRGPSRELVGHAEYHLRAKGGLSMMKWQGTKAKMDPVIDELLAGTRVAAAPTVAPQRSVVQPATRETAGLSRDEQIQALQLENLDYVEYQRRYQQILQNTAP